MDHPDRQGDLRRGLLAGVAIAALMLPPAAQPGRVAHAVSSDASTSTAEWRLADFGNESPSPDARSLADWIASSADNAGADFVIIDKQQATLYVFDAQARLRASSPVLLGAAQGDDSVAGIGARPIDLVRLHERTTPAGRFVAERGRNVQGEDVIWVDYDAAVSMHRVRATRAEERRIERLATPSVDDNRISYGCINVPATFYDTYIVPAFSTRGGLVYVLPEVRSLKQVFTSYEAPATASVALAAAARPHAAP